MQLFPLISLAVLVYSQNVCEQNCVDPLPPFYPSISTTACFFDSNGVLTTVTNNWCAPNTVVGTTDKFDCYAWYLNQGILYPGACGCPELCSIDVGTCTSGSCVCEAGWIGESCAFVESCGIEPCKCESERCLNDCSGSDNPVPAYPPELIPGDRFSKWDDYGMEHPFFNSVTITQAYITISLEDLEQILRPSMSGSRDSYPAQLRLYNSDLDEQLDVEFRHKGGWSRTFFHKSFKGKLAEEKKQIKSIEWKSGEMDPVFLRDYWTNRFLYSMDAPFRRTAFTQLFINNQFFGGYLAQEALDDLWLKSRFNDGDRGYLFKSICCNRYPLVYHGNNWSDYQSTYEFSDGPNEQDAKAKLIEMITILSQTTVDNMTAFENVFDIDMFFRTFVVDVLTGQIDGFANGNNYCLYYSPDSGKWIYFRHDLDLSWGATDPDYSGYDVINVFQYGIQIPLVQLLLNSSYYRVLYIEMLRIGLDWLKQPLLKYEMLETQNFIKPLMSYDTWRGFDFYWSLEMFEQGLTMDFVYGHHLAYWQGMFNFIRNRVESAEQQIDTEIDAMIARFAVQ